MLTSDQQIVVRLDANASLGRGHAVRVAALLAALDSRAEVCVAGEFSGDDKSSLFPGAEWIDSGAFYERCQTADLILVDHPDLAWVPREVRGLRVVIDDSGLASDADLIVNGNAPPSRHRYDGLDRSIPRLCGLPFALLRPEFGEVTRPDSSRSTGPLVIAGSGSTARDWIFELASTPNLWDDPTTVVVGPGFAEVERLEDATSRGIQVRQGLGTHELATLLANCSVAVTTGGMIVPEALAAGACCVAFANEPDLEEEIAVLEEHGALISLGRNGGADSVGAALERLAQSQDLRRSLRKTARACVDGKGAERVAQVIGGMLTEGSAS